MQLTGVAALLLMEGFVMCVPEVVTVMPWLLLLAEQVISTRRL